MKLQLHNPYHLRIAHITKLSHLKEFAVEAGFRVKPDENGLRVGRIVQTDTIIQRFQSEFKGTFTECLEYLLDRWKNTHESPFCVRCGTPIDTELKYFQCVECVNHRDLASDP